MHADQHRHREAVSTASDVAKRLLVEGAEAVVLTGSFARGTAGPHSDIDLHAIGRGPAYALERVGAFLVSISWKTADDVRASFEDVFAAGAAVPGWRSASILEDPAGIASERRDEALAWSWERFPAGAVEREAARYVYGFAEEVQKLTAARANGDQLLAAVQRSVLALRLALPISVVHHILYDSENDLWKLVNEAMGEPWSSTQSRALGIGGESLAETCDAAIELFAQACELLEGHFSDEERAVVEQALRLRAS